MKIILSGSDNINLEQTISWYRIDKCCSVDKPYNLYQAKFDSPMPITAWSEDNIVGLGKAISDGHIKVYYSQPR